MTLQRSSFARWWALAVLLGALALPPAPAALPAAPLPLVPLSGDPYTNTASQHQTQVEPDAFSFGSTIVAAFQVGRFYDGGSSNIGWASSQDSGASWAHGFLPGLTVAEGGSYNRVSDPSVAYDARHGAWLVISLPLLQGGLGNAVAVNRSTNGGTAWSAPVFITETFGLDKTWLACDNSATSPFYGSCYAQWSVFGRMVLSVSRDGGLSWDAPRGPSAAFGLGGPPVVQPNGAVIVPYLGSGIAAFRSTDGGQSWETPVQIATVPYVPPSQIGVRGLSLPTAAIDANGRVFVAWAGCDAAAGCETNDLWMSWSDDGASWPAPARIAAGPPDLRISAVLPGLAIEPGTAGASARIGLMFYYYYSAPCKRDSGKLFAGFTSSADGGATWAPAVALAGPFEREWLALTNQGRMVGDYMDVGFAGGRAFPIFSLPRAPLGAQFDQVIATVAGGLAPGVALPERAISAENLPCRYLPLVQAPDPFARPTPLR